MARSTDITIFGATGFTGQRVAAEAVKSMPQHIRSAGTAQSTDPSILFLRKPLHTCAKTACSELTTQITLLSCARSKCYDVYVHCRCRITLAGRSTSKLQSLAQQLGSDRVKVRSPVKAAASNDTHFCIMLATNH